MATPTPPPSPRAAAAAAAAAALLVPIVMPAAAAPRFRMDPRLPPCDSKNFLHWRGLALSHLDLIGLEQAVTTPVPGLVGSSVVYDRNAVVSPEDQAAQQKEWDDKCNSPEDRVARILASKQAYHLLVSSLQPSDQYLIGDCAPGNAHELWTRINKSLGKLDMMNKPAMMREFHSMTQTASESVQVFVGRVHTLVGQLHALNANIDLDTVLSVVLPGIHPRYLTIHQERDRLGTMSIDNVITMGRAFDLRTASAIPSARSQGPSLTESAHLAQTPAN